MATKPNKKLAWLHSQEIFICFPSNDDAFDSSENLEIFIAWFKNFSDFKRNSLKSLFQYSCILAAAAISSEKNLLSATEDYHEAKMRRIDVYNDGKEMLEDEIATQHLFLKDATEMLESLDTVCSALRRSIKKQTTPYGYFSQTNFCFVIPND